MRFKVGTQVEVGPYSFEVIEAGPSEWSEGWAFSLRSEADLSAIVRYALVDQQGQELELNRGWSMSGGGTWTQSLVCATAQERATLVVEYWKDPEVVRVPFDLSPGLGLR